LACLPQDGLSHPAMLVGSVAEGFGNSTSDVDVMVIGSLDSIANGIGSADDLKGFSDLQSGKRAKAIAARMPTGGTIFHPLLAGHRVQLEVLSEEYISRRIRGIRSVLGGSRGESPSEGDDGGMNTFGDFRILHRFMNGRPLQGAGSLESLREGLTRGDLADYFVAAHNITLNSFVEDFVGVRKKAHGAEIETEALLIDRCLVTLAQLLLCAVGETSPGEKFIFRLQRRHADEIGTDLADEFQRIYMRSRQYAGGDVTPVLAFIDKVLDRCEELSPFFRTLAARTKRQHLNIEGDWHRSN